jgi:hypothetical protein
MMPRFRGKKALPERQDSYPLICPLLAAAALALAVVPWLHPNNTCHDWLEKWGQLTVDPMWLPIHKVAAAGFALAGGAGLLLALLGPPSRLGLMGGASLAAGYGMQAMLVLIHAAAVGSLGRAYNAAGADAARQQSIRTTAEAFVNYDVAVSGVAAPLISLGAALTAWSLARARVLSTPAAAFLAALGAIWTLAYYHYSVGEWLPYTSLALWQGGLASLLLVRSQKAS